VYGWYEFDANMSVRMSTRCAVHFAAMPAAHAPSAIRTAPALVDQAQPTFLAIEA
jgi:hypothetical protein